MNKKVPEKLIPVGKIIKSHGIKGELKVSIYNKNSETLVNGLIVWFNFDNKFKNYQIKYVRGSIKNTIVKLNQIENIDQIGFLISKEIFVSRNDFPVVSGNNYYLSDLIGMKILDKNERSLGIVIDVLNLPANDVILIEYKGKEVMIPNVDDFIKLFDFKNNIIRVKNIKTLFEL